jgi:hypothetical protein
MVVPTAAGPAKPIIIGVSKAIAKNRDASVFIGKAPIV